MKMLTSTWNLTDTLLETNMTKFHISHWNSNDQRTRHDFTTAKLLLQILGYTNFVLFLYNQKETS